MPLRIPAQTRFADPQLQRFAEQVIAALKQAGEGDGDELVFDSPVALAVGGPNVDGVSEHVVRADHMHALPAFGDGAGEIVEGNDARLSGLFARTVYQANASNMAWGLVGTWTTLHSAITVTDVEQTGISRSNSDLTFTDAGTYNVFWRASMANGTAGKNLGLRLRDTSGGVTKCTGSTFVNAASIGTAIVAEDITVTAGQVLQLQYVTGVTGTMGGLGGNVVDGETMLHMHLVIRRVAG